MVHPILRKRFLDLTLVNKDVLTTWDVAYLLIIPTDSEDHFLKSQWYLRQQGFGTDGLERFMICLNHNNSVVDVLVELATSKNDCYHFHFNGNIPCFNVLSVSALWDWYLPWRMYHRDCINRKLNVISARQASEPIEQLRVVIQLHSSY